MAAITKFQVKYRPESRSLMITMFTLFTTTNLMPEADLP